MTDPKRPDSDEAEVLEAEPVPTSPANESGAAALAKWHGRRRLAWVLAISADALQIALLPALVVGVPLVEAIDIAMAIALFFLLGWHLAFLPTLLAEAIPVVNLVPTWTAAVWLVTRSQKPPTGG